jgi:hypothetical protein
MDELERSSETRVLPGSREATVRTYVDRSQIFVRWLSGATMRTKALAGFAAGPKARADDAH